MAGGRLWVLDGHNMIFAIEDLQRHQVEGRGEEARGRLVEALERFAHRRGEKVLIVFDGHALPSRPEIRASSVVEVAYGRRGGGGADRRILIEARGRAERGLAVTVVTDDIRTLAIDLPRGVRHLGVREFWQEHIDRPRGDDEKPVAGDFSDIEQAMLALAPEPPRARQVGDRHTATAPDRSSGAAAAKPPGAEALRQEALRRKRERGRLRQARHVRRRRVPRGGT